MTFAVKTLLPLAGLTAMFASCPSSFAQAKLIPIVRPATLRSERVPRLILETPDDQSNKREPPAADAEALPTQDSTQKSVSEQKPVVTYDQGQLTITAENVTLSDILSALHQVMGTEVDLPAGATRERIWAHLGPGPARKILADKT